jgi:hypothetical protein
VGVLEHGLVEAVLAAEMVMDGGQIGLGQLGDLADRGGLVALAGKDFAGGVKKPPPGFVLATVARHQTAFRERVQSEFMDDPQTGQYFPEGSAGGYAFVILFPDMR